MNTAHFWFRSGDSSLLAHLDAPRQETRGVGAIIVPPFGWEDVCAYRPLRFMAQTFAAMGIPTLRYDLPGTGDSSGGPQEPGLLRAWIQSVADAAAELRLAAGVEEVAAVGIHFGALLALASAARGEHIQHLVMWGGAARGRSIIRELRAAANVERWEYLVEPEAPPQPLPGLESGGFLISPETAIAIERLDARLLRPRCRRVLLLSRDELPHDANLVAALESAVPVELACGRGYSAMLGQPQEAAAPKETSRAIAEFVTRETAKSTPVRAGLAPQRHSTLGRDAFESIYLGEGAPRGTFGILAEPATSKECGESCLLYLNAGGVRHIGPNRMWVESARRWAARGVSSLRLDLHGIGESDGDECLSIPDLYQECLVDQIRLAIDSLRRNTRMKRFIAIGLCSGACWAFHTAIRSPDVRAAIVLNPSLLYWDPAVDRKRMVKLFASGFSAWTGYARVVLGGLQRGEIRRGARRVVERLRRRGSRPGVYLDLGFETVAQAWSALEQSGKRVTLVFREGEALLREMESASELPPEGNSFVRCLRVPNGGHTFRPLWAQKLVHAIIDAEIAKASVGPRVSATV